MRSKLASRPDLQDLIIPKDFAVGCRRPTPGNGYLEALCEDNVNVVSSSIQEITPKGMKTADGVEHDFDIIVCATGFDVSWRPHYPTIGRDGVSLSEYWRDTPNTYLSMTVANMPNYVSKLITLPSILTQELGLKFALKSSTALTVPTVTEVSSPSPKRWRDT